MNITKPTVGSITEKIDEIHFQRFGETCTVCALVLKTGFVVIGQSAAIDPADFDEDSGKKIAYENAEDKLWELEAYLAKQ